MSEKKTNQNKKVTVRLFKDSGRYRDDVFVAVNGETFLVRRGVDVEVPDYVAEVLRQSQEQDHATETLMDKQETAYAAAAERL